MATHPSATSCAACRAPLAPGAKFCGSCGGAVGARAVPPAAPDFPPQPPPAWVNGQAAGYDTVLFAGPPEQAMPRIGAALGHAGARALGQTLSGFRFEHPFGMGLRYTGEATVRPDGRGSTAVTATLQLDQGRFFVVAGIMLVVGVVLSLVLLGGVALIAVIVVLGILGGLYASAAGSQRTKALQGITAALQQAAARPGPQAFAPPPAAAPAPSAPTEQLRHLAEQRDRGLIDTEQFERAKASILGQLR